MSELKVAGWGQYPKISAHLHEPEDLHHMDWAAWAPLIPRGLGRSYGDSSLSSHILSTRYLNHFINFDETRGILTCEGGVSFAEIIRLFLPRGWFLPVTPGTKFITVGGAIASDIHGKNHHTEGCFSEFVLSMKVLLPDGQVLSCSPEQNEEFFRATCGGMGLTGLITEATIQLKKVNSRNIDQKTFKAKNLEHVFELFEKNKSFTYSVAWIDCLDKKNLGRSLLMVGEHANDGDLQAVAPKPKPVPCNAPHWLLSPLTVKAFNTLYYNKVLRAESTQKVSYDPFFYPLDQLSHWYRLYGREGFLQYQMVFPLKQSLEGMRESLELIASSRKASFLAVLKLFGPENKNYLSFPSEGYTLALDFQYDSTTLALMNKLDDIVAKYGGRIYLTKDARMSEQLFKSTYPQIEKFTQVRLKYPSLKQISSLQSVRLGLDLP